MYTYMHTRTHSVTHARTHTHTHTHTHTPGTRWVCLRYISQVFLLSITSSGLSSVFGRLPVFASPSMLVLLKLRVRALCSPVTMFTAWLAVGLMLHAFLWNRVPFPLSSSSSSQPSSPRRALALSSPKAVHSCLPEGRGDLLPWRSSE